MTAGEAIGREGRSLRSASTLGVECEDPNYTIRRWDMAKTGLEALTAAILNRTGGKLLGELTAEELRAAFSGGPIIFRDGEAVDDGQAADPAVSA